MNQVTQPAPNGAAVASDLPEPLVLYVRMHSGEVWRVGKETPDDDSLLVKRFVVFEDVMVKVYTYPKPGSELDHHKSGAEFTLPWFGVKQISTLARFDVLRMMEEQAIEDSLPEEEEEEEETPAPVPAQANGVAS